MRYRDALSAIKWLCSVLGFKEHVVFQDKGIVHHAELTFGNGMIMIGTLRDGPFDKLIKIPVDIENINTQSAYIYTDKLDAHYAHAKNSGAEIVLPLKKDPHGSGYTCRDPEGYLWSFGDFNPWVNESE